jgi:hypothetical protein
MSTNQMKNGTQSGSAVAGVMALDVAWVRDEKGEHRKLIASVSGEWLLTVKPAAWKLISPSQSDFSWIHSSEVHRIERLGRTKSRSLGWYLDYAPRRPKAP